MKIIVVISCDEADALELTTAIGDAVLDRTVEAAVVSILDSGGWRLHIHDENTDRPNLREAIATVERIRPLVGWEFARTPSGWLP